MRRTLAMIALLLAAGPAAGEEAAKPIRHRVTGLFAREREEHLRQALERLPEFELVEIDFERAEVSLRYDPAKVFPGATPEQVIERFDRRIREVSRSTFGIKPLRTIPDEQLEWVEIPVEGLDCLACSFGAYRAVYELPGVEQATASFRDGRVRALIDPKRIDRVALETALKERGVMVVSAAE